MLKKYFSPQPDISTYALCEILCKCSNLYLGCRTGVVFKSIEEFEKLPFSIRRHFTDEPTRD